MAYSQVGIVNLSLSKLGVKRISSMSENSETAISANASWQYIVDEVLSSKDWFFAKLRVALAKNVTAPAYGYTYAYTLPADFLRLCGQDANDVSVFPSGLYSSDWTTGELMLNYIYNHYKIEIISDGTLCLLTDYDNTDDDLYITYIKRITDVNKFSPAFVSALSFRLAAELSIIRTESRPKFQDMMNLYDSFLRRAEGYNQHANYIDDETGSTDWINAGR